MVSETIPAFFAYMALAGCSAAFLAAGSAAVIGDIVSGRKGGPVVSTYQMTSDFGMVVGPLLTGYMRDVSGGYFWPFAFSTAITVALVVLVARMPETKTRHYLRAY